MSFLLSLVLPLISWKTLIPLGWQALEYWLGKTTKTVSGSVPEFLLTGEALRLTLQMFKKQNGGSMDNKVGIENLKKVIDLAAELAVIGEKVVANGSSVLADLPIVVSEGPTLAKDVAAVVPAMSQVIAEFKDIEATEAEELLAYTVAKFSVDNAKAVAIIDASLKIVFGGIELLQAVKS